MPYTVPTAAEFKASYPTFGAVTDDIVNAALAEASGRVDTTWMETDFRPAIMLYTAHVLTMNGQGSGNETQLSGFRSLGIGPLRIEMLNNTALGTLNSTSYGRRFAEIQRRNHYGLAVV